MPSSLPFESSTGSADMARSTSSSAAVLVAVSGVTAMTGRDMISLTFMTITLRQRARS